MITDPYYVFAGFAPAGFDQFEATSSQLLHYQQKVTQKTYNELNNKLKELRLLQERLKQAKPKDCHLEQMFLKGEWYTLVQTVLKDEQMVQKLAYKLTQHQSKVHDRVHPINKECR
jgi:Holliday junction resolvasome RuvABC endonuclease subunit